MRTRTDGRSSGLWGGELKEEEEEGEGRPAWSEKKLVVKTLPNIHPNSVHSEWKLTSWCAVELEI